MSRCYRMKPRSITIWEQAFALTSTVAFAFAVTLWYMAKCHQWWPTMQELWMNAFNSDSLLGELQFLSKSFVRLKKDIWIHSSFLYRNTFKVFSYGNELCIQISFFSLSEVCGCCLFVLDISPQSKGMEKDKDVYFLARLGLGHLRAKARNLICSELCCGDDCLVELLNLT